MAEKNNPNQQPEFFSNPRDPANEPVYPGAPNTWREMLKPKKTIQIAACGEVMITLPEMEIIDTRDFQRLRRVRQLGAACVVYPTALHTRFDHSLGTLEMVWKMIRSITGNQHNADRLGNITPRQKCLARFYALVHDVPHIPFGHTIEDELCIFERHDKNTARIERFLGAQSDIGKIVVNHFGDAFHADLMRLYRWDEEPDKWKGSKDDAFVHDLVSNTVCADLLDYLRRDDFFCNLGVSIRYQFLNYLYIDEQKDCGLRRVFVRLSKNKGHPRRDLLSDLCRLLEARYLIAERVYFHHAKITAGAMLGRAIQEASLISGSDGQLELTEEKMYSHSDDTLVAALQVSQSHVARRLARAYSDRALYEVWEEYRHADIEKSQNKENAQNAYKHLEETAMDSRERRRLENLLTEFTFTEQGDILFYAPDWRMNRKEARMRVLWQGEQKEFKDIDDPIAKPNTESILAAHKRLWSLRVLAKRGLDEWKKKTALKFVDAEFFTLDEAERKKLRLSLCKSVVRHASNIEGWATKGNGTEAAKQTESAAERLMEIYETGVVHHGGAQTVQQRLVAIRAEFFATS